MSDQEDELQTEEIRDEDAPIDLGEEDAESEEDELAESGMSVIDDEETGERSFVKKVSGDGEEEDDLDMDDAFDDKDDF